MPSDEVRECRPICQALGDIGIEELNLSVMGRNCLERAEIFNVAQLYDKLNEGLVSCMRIRHLTSKGLVVVLRAARAVGYPLDPKMEAFLRDRATVGISEKEERISKIDQVNVTVEKPDYGSYTDGTSGFTIFATIHSRKNQVASVEMKEFMLFSSNRQWAASKDLAGYAFSTEHIMPMSSKTAAKIWSGTPWNHTKLQDGDYVTIVLSVDYSANQAFKFVLKDGLFTIDDYCTY